MNSALKRHIALRVCIAAALGSAGKDAARLASISNFPMQDSSCPADDGNASPCADRLLQLARVEAPDGISPTGHSQGTVLLQQVSHRSDIQRMPQVGKHETSHASGAAHAGVVLKHSTTSIAGVTHTGINLKHGTTSIAEQKRGSRAGVLHTIPGALQEMVARDLAGKPKKKVDDSAPEVGPEVPEEQKCRGDVKNNRTDLSTVHGDDWMLPICGATTHQHAHGGGESLLLIVFLMLALGCLTSYMLRRKVSALPYTCMLFIEGFLIALAHRWITHGAWTSYDIAYSLFGNADPHLILYIFLPALVFGESMSLNSNMVANCLPQCLLLAGPGVLIGTLLTGVAAKYILPYGWDWQTSMLLGSILAATDPVAVVSIFKSIGVSPRLTMLISGESLLNDGVAIVLFQLFIEMCQGVTPTAFGILKFFAWMTTIGPLLGVGVGVLAIWAIEQSSSHGVDLHGIHGDAMVQLVCTFVCAYLSFFVAESELHTSGVLSLVATGSFMASYVWPRFNSRETLQDIWHVADFIGNTLIFMLAGLILGDICASRTHFITLMDCVYLILIYIISLLIRTIMVAILWLPINQVGQPVSKEEAAVMVWSGIRGAVGLLMAVVADRSPGISPETGTRILFYVGGMAALMLLANGTLTPFVLQICGFRDTTNEQHAMLLEVQDRLASKTRDRLEAQVNSDTTAFLFQGARLSQLPSIVQTMNDVTTESTNLAAASLKGAKNHDGVNIKLLELLRDTVRTITKSVYWDMCEMGLLPRGSIVTKVLMDSSDIDKMSNNDWQLDAWRTIHRELQLEKFSSEQEWAHRISVGRFLKKVPFTIFCQRGILASLAFIHAHEEAMTNIEEYWGSRTQDIDKIQEEIEAEMEKAKKFLDEMNADLVATVKTKLLASDLLHFQMAEIKSLTDTGVITQEQAHQLKENVEKEVHRNWEGWENGWEETWT